jgi:hypothetical protein
LWAGAGAGRAERAHRRLDVDGEALAALVRERERERHALAFLERLLQVHQHHVVRAGPERHDSAGRQFDLRGRRPSS